MFRSSVVVHLHLLKTCRTHREKARAGAIGLAALTSASEVSVPGQD